MPGETPFDPTSARHALVGRLTRGALHELGNPLLALLGTAELAAGDAEPGSRLAARVDLVSATAAEIAEVVRALQRVARVGDDEPAERIDLATVAADAVALVRRLAPAGDSDSEAGLAAQGAWVVAPPGAVLLALAALLLDAPAPGSGPTAGVVVTRSGGRVSALVPGSRAGREARALVAAAGGTLAEDSAGAALVLPSAV